MELKDELNWQYIYKNSYHRNFEDFYKYMLSNRKNYLKLSDENRQIITEKYLYFYEKTLKLFEVFFANNCYFISENRLIVIYILSCNILAKGNLLYELYVEMKNVKDKKCCIGAKFIKNNYINLFKEISNFFNKRLEIEDSYGL